MATDELSAADVEVDKAVCRLLASGCSDAHLVFNAVTFGIEALACDVRELVVIVSDATDWSNGICGINAGLLRRVMSSVCRSPI